MRPDLSCDRATRVAHRTLVQLGYTVTELVPATRDRHGRVAGTRPSRDGGVTRGLVRIKCRDGGAVLEPVEEALVPNYEFSRGFGYSFKELVKRPDVEEPAAGTSLEILVRTLDRHQALLDLGGVPTVGEVVPVRLTVRNNTDRAVRLDPTRIDLLPPEGDPRRCLAGHALEAAIAPGAAGSKLRDDLLGTRPIPAHTTVTGFLVYPPGTYAEARIAIEDVETGETEGFVTPVQ